MKALSIVAAFPIGIVIIMIVISFMKDSKKYMKEVEGLKDKAEVKIEEE